MKTVTVAVGSTRAPKVDAVREALALIGNFLIDEALAADALADDAPAESREIRFEVVGAPVASGVSHTPQSRAELMAGARGRVEALRALARQRGADWSYFIGLEGGLEVVRENGRRWAFLENWAFVSDGRGRESYGQAGGIALPEPLAEEVIDRGTELAVAIDAYAAGRGIRDAQGAWGVLTRDLIPREEAYRIAVIQAFAPFFNRTIYRQR